MTGSAARRAAIVCSICSRLIPLETSNTDERGHAVHEDCYVRQMVSKSRPASALHLSEDWLSAILLRFQLSFREADNY
jgi:hypothetical protein